jgi:hypothetical protein
VPLHSTRQGLMPPPHIKSGPGSFKRLFWVIPCGKTQMARCQPTQMGMTETSRSGLRYKASGCRILLKGPRVCQLLATQIQDHAFHTLIGNLTHAPLLQLPDFSKTFELKCDVSGIDFGGICHTPVLKKHRTKTSIRVPRMF